MSIYIKYKILFISSILLAVSVSLNAVNKTYTGKFPAISETEILDYFPLVSNREVSKIFIDTNDFPVVNISSQMLSDDIKRVTGKNAIISRSESLSEIRGQSSVVIGTIGNNTIIDELIDKDLIDVDTIKNKWESFLITTIRHPEYDTPILVIAGSDRRGTAYGVTSLCEAIGVSPWYWWADVIPTHKNNIYVEPGVFVQGEPSIQYRGIFINDERFGGWAKWVENTFDKETGEVGPKVYRTVFELLLRLKGNYLWPAMHRGSKPFNANPENARIADEYAIVMGSSHCEQMLRNNEGEWRDHKEYGDFNYVTNRPTMIKYWEDRIKTNGRYENIYTLGLRGIHDYPMEGARTDDERTDLMQKAINDQRDILRRNIDKPIERIPQILCTYEEVLDAYHNGLNVPDDVTFLWCDDKQGYIRNLSNPMENKRSGGSGIYYHLSYHGDPASWLWLSPLSPVFISTELTKAYTFGARKIWIFNVGDIKPAEKEISFAMELAWDIDRWRPEVAHTYIKEWAKKTFGELHADEIFNMQSMYYELMASGKDSHIYFIEYPEKELEERLSKYKKLSEMAMTYMEVIPEHLKNAYFELVLYPIHGAAMLNEYQLLSRRSMVNVTHGDSIAAMKDAATVNHLFDELNDWTNEYNKYICDGKWDNFFSWVPYHWRKMEGVHPEIATPDAIMESRKYPKPLFLPKVEIMSEKGVTIESDTEVDVPLWIKAVSPIKNFSKSPENNIFCRILYGDTSFDASASVINNIWHTHSVGPKWNNVGRIKLKKGENILHITDVSPDARIDSVFLGFYPPFPDSPEFIIPASGYNKKHDNSEGKVMIIKRLGFQDGVIVMPFDVPSYEKDELNNAPFIEYNIKLKKGTNKVEIRTLPTLHVYEGRDARYAVCFNDNRTEVFSIHTDDFSSEWRCNVLRGYSSRCINVDVSKDGIYPLRICFMDPGIVLQEIRIN